MLKKGWIGFKGNVNYTVNQHFYGKYLNHEAYLCSSLLMINSAITTLIQARLFERDIHMKRFLTNDDWVAEYSRSALFKKI